MQFLSTISIQIQSQWRSQNDAEEVMPPTETNLLRFLLSKIKKSEIKTKRKATDENTTFIVNPLLFHMKDRSKSCYQVSTLHMALNHCSELVTRLLVLLQHSCLKAHIKKRSAKDKRNIERHLCHDTENEC